MSWTVPQGCYYAWCDAGSTQFYYYGANSTVPTERAPNNYAIRTYHWILADFNNGYMYTGMTNATINANSNNKTFTVSGYQAGGVIMAVAVGSHDTFANLNINGFAFGNGTGLLDKSAFLSSSHAYALQSTFKNRTDITSATIPNGVVVLVDTFYGCTNLQTVSGTLNNICGAYHAFDDCPKLVSIPAFPSSIVSHSDVWSGYVGSFRACFQGCSAFTTAPTFPTGTTDMQHCFYGCSSLTTAPTILSTVTNIRDCFCGCSSLTTAPTIPASVTDMRWCFENCTSVAGNIEVYNEPQNYTDAFINTTNDIFIVNKAGTSGTATTWRTIASGYSNVHYEADDNQIPSLSFTATRVGGMASETPSENGEYAFINATAIVYETYLPDGWSCNYDEGGENLTNDSVTQSPYWTRTDNDNVWTLKCWLSLGDTTKHTFTLQVADEITDENDNVKASQLSAIITQIIPKAYKLVDYYHDPTTDTEGMSIGKFATDANLLDVDMPALFRDTLSLNDRNSVAHLLFDFVYPVGSYYETSLSATPPSGGSTPTQADIALLGSTWFDPRLVWGGQWELEASGKFHISAGTGYGLGTMDGSPDAVIVKHNHTQNPHNHSQNSHHHIAFKYKTAQLPTGSSGAIRVWDYGHSGDSTANTNDVTATNIQSTAINIETGVDGTGKNLPPYVAVNRWHRTG